MSTSPNFTPKSQKLILEAKLFASSLHHAKVTEAHLLVVLLESKGGFLRDFIRSFGLKAEEFIAFVLVFSSLSKEKGGKPIPPQSVKYTTSFKKILEEAHNFSISLDHSHVGLEHIFFSLINPPEGAAAQFFFSNQVHPSKVIETFILILKTQDILLDKKRESTDAVNYTTASSPSSTSVTPALDSFAINFNSLARNGSLNKIIGKTQEIERLCEILGRKTKNNPLLLGEPGVGKTAVVEGLAQKIVSSEAPAFLAQMEVYSVDLASMIAGTKYRGQFEQRLKTLIKECSEDKNIILFIDEIHTLVGAGSAEGTMDAANILKPALARGEIKLIGATTFAENKKSIAKDIALSRRFEVLSIEEPTTNECYQILKGIKSSYESFHAVKYSASILKNISSLCDTYLPSKNFPDKAIDVLDEAGAKVKIKNLTPPPGLIRVENEIYQLLDAGETDYEAESRLIDSYDELMGDWEDAIVTQVSMDDIIHIVATKAKVPKENLIHEKDKKSISLIRNLNRDIINQRPAVTALHKCILRAKIGLKDPHKPIGSFLFLGATGVGKTWSAKKLAKHYFGSEKNLFRFDMSEYSEKVSSSKLIGASPGYVGYEEGGLLIESIKKKPHCVLLFDEIEKSHPEVQQLLLQILEEGELEDNMGTRAYFKDCIVILTSNIGSDLTVKSSLGFSPDSTSCDSKIKEKAKKILSPELTNRLDDIIVFNHLEEEHLLKIFKHNLRLLSKRLSPKNITLEVAEDVASFICKESAAEKMGARPLKRWIQSKIEDQIVDFYFKNNTSAGQTFVFFLDDDKVVFRVK